MQFKNILATICAFSVAGTIAGPVPVEGSEIAKRATPNIDPNVIHGLAQDALTRKNGATGTPPTKEQIDDLMKKVGGKTKRDAEADADVSDVEKRWIDPYWRQYNWGYNGYNYLYYCGSWGSYCYYPYSYANTYYWYTLYNGYYTPFSYYNNGYYNYNYWGNNWGW